MMSEQRKHQNEQNIHITREQVIAVGGTLLTSGIIDVATHFNPAYTLAGLVAIYAAGRLTPEVVKFLVPGSDPEATIKTVARLVDHLDREPPQEEERQQDV